MRNPIMAIVLLVFSLCSLVARQPNFVLIFIDDMGYGDIGPYGSTKNRTPRLDRMAEEGMRLTSFYAAPVCSVSRAQVMTGCYGPRVSVPGVFFPAGGKGLNPDEYTIAEQLRDLGYATACIGKWHLGDQPPFLPTNHGFDTYYGIPYSNDMGRTAKESGKRVHPVLRDDQVFKLIEDAEQSDITQEYTEEAIAFMRKNQDKPFFLYLPHTAMHVPIYPGKRLAGKSKNGRYGDWVEELDWSTGAVLDAIKELGLEKDTLVIFTSDNGPWLSKGTDGGESGPLRGGKGGTFEGGVRVPTIARWPGRIAAGSSSDLFAGNIDFLPTFVKLGGGKASSKKPIDGKDFSPILFGKAKRSAHDAWFYYRGMNLRAVRSGDWKLALGPQSEGMGLKTTSKDALSKNPRLYNLKEEIGERTDLAAKNPGIVKRLAKLADGIIADIGSGKGGPGVRPPGIVENPVTLYPTEPRQKRSNRRIVKQAPLEKMSVGDSLEPAKAPVMVKTAFSIQCLVETETKDGMIIGHGGSAVGYSVYLKAGQPVFALRTGSDVSRAVGEVIAAKKFSLEIRLGKKGEVSFFVDGKPSGRGKVWGTLKSHPAESLNVGFDERNPVDPQGPTGRFKGRISGLVIKAMK